jgi:hypothetical protein
VIEEKETLVRRLLLAVGLLLVAAPAAFAGGWATVGLSSTPSGTQPGEPWVVDMTVLQHGRTPLEGVQPKLTITNGDARRTFAAKATDKPGVYRVSVVFPTAGRWTYQVDDGFVTGVPHTFPPVEIGAPASAASTTTSDDGGPNLFWLVPGIVLLLAAGGLLLRGRMRRVDRHQPQAA